MSFTLGVILFPVLFLIVVFCLPGWYAIGIVLYGFVLAIYERYDTTKTITDAELYQWIEEHKDPNEKHLNDHEILMTIVSGLMLLRDNFFTEFIYETPQDGPDKEIGDDYTVCGQIFYTNEFPYPICYYIRNIFLLCKTLQFEDKLSIIRFLVFLTAHERRHAVTHLADPIIYDISKMMNKDHSKRLVEKLANASGYEALMSFERTRKLTFNIVNSIQTESPNEEKGNAITTDGG